MKQFFLSIIFSAVMGVGAYAQCTPDKSITTPGIYPRILPQATAGVAYSEVVQFRFPKDTTAGQFTVPIDSVRIDSVVNFPSGFSFKCSNATCTYPGESNGCALITGNPTASQAGVYKLKIYGTAYLNLGGTSYPNQYVEGLDFTVVDHSGFAEKKAAPINAELKQNMPNPFNVATRIEYSVPTAQQVTFKVYDVLGQVVYTSVKQARAGNNFIDLQRGNLGEGMYFYSIQYGNLQLTKRMMIGK